MRKLRGVLILLITFLISFSGCKNKDDELAVDLKLVSPLTQEQKVEDFNFMYSILKESYPYLELNKRVNGVDWLANKEVYVNKIKATNSDREFYDSLQSILKELNNGHTNILQEQSYPLYKKLYERDKKSNAAWIKELNKSQAKRRYGETEKNIDSNNNVNKEKDYIDTYNVKTDIIKKDEVGYLSIASLNSFNIESDMKIIKPFLNEVKSYKALIIDIRGNSGGDSRYWSEKLVPMLIDKPLKNVEYVVYRGSNFIEAFVKSRYGIGYKGLKSIKDIDKENLMNLPEEVKNSFKYYSKQEEIIKPKDSIDFKGKIFLLVDRWVYSSSEMFATFCKSTGFAILVGEKTGGDGIGSDPALCTLPNSGYIVRFPKEMGLTSDGSCNEEFKTEPDFKVPAERNFDLSKDQAINKVLELIK